MNDGLRGKRVVLIGGAGFIGHHLALSLAGHGAGVHVIDGLQVNNLGWFASNSEAAENRDLYVRIIHERLELLYDAGVPLHVQDARDYHALSRLLSEIDPHVIVHLAAVAHAGRSNKDPYSTFDHSLRTLENALDCARGNVEHFVYLSSSMVYGNFRTEQVSEDHQLEPIGIYGALKLAGERIVVAYQQVFDLPYTIIRPSALYGPRCVSRRVGQVFIENAFTGQRLVVHGDGRERLDFTYVDDLTEGICLTIDSTRARNETFNMTFGSARSIQDLVAIVKQRFPGVEIEEAERDSLVPYRGTLSIDKARELLGYDPRYPIDVGFPVYMDWYADLYGRLTALASGRPVFNREVSATAPVERAPKK